LSYPPDYEGIIKSQIAAMAPGVMFNDEFDAMPKQWDYWRTLRWTATDERPANEKLVPGLNKALEAPEKDEAALLQFVLSPHGRGDLEGEFAVAARAAARGVRTRPKSILRHIEKAYGSLGVSVGKLQKASTYRVTKRSAPPHEWPQRLTSRQVAIFAGLAEAEANRIQVPATPMVPREGILLGVSNYPGPLRPIAVREQELLMHAWVLGPTGRGKSTLFHRICVQLMQRGYGFALLEPKGDLCEDVLASVPEPRIHDVIWLDPRERKRPVGLNLLAGDDPELTTYMIVGLFKGSCDWSVGALTVSM
jgi:hypothetical protein